MTTSGTIRAGMGGWTFEPWEGTFYPDKLSKKKQLEFASRGADHRGQRHLLFRFQARDLCQMERRDAGRFCLLDQGQPLRHQPQNSGGGRRVDGIFRARAGGTGTSSGRSSGNSRRRKNSSRRISRLFEAPAATR